MQLGVLWHLGLDEDGGLFRIDARGQPIDHHFPDRLLDDGDFVVVGGQRVPVGDHEVAVVAGLQLDPVLDHAVVVAQMQAARRAHAGKNAVGKHGVSGSVSDRLRLRAKSRAARKPWW
ncbi:hypothetical protein D3C72_2197850 [compost metagenome]